MPAIPNFMNFVKLALFCTVLSALFTMATIWLARRQSWLFHPKTDRWNRRSVAKFGGIAIFLSFLCGSLTVALSKSSLALLLLTAAMAALGLWDDVRNLSPWLKLLGQVTLATVAVRYGFVYLLTPSQTLNAAFSIFFIVAITNAFNLLDNMDGLAAGVGITTAVTILLLQASSTSAALVVAMAAALLGYLFFNFPPARIFMGDTGSLMVGFFWHVPS